jgi:hypothetical protein
VFDDDGMPLPAATAELGSDEDYFAFALLASGDALATGVSLSGPVITRFDASWSAQWSTQGGEDGPAVPRSIALDAGEQPFIVGQVFTVGAPDAWAAGFRADGARWWSDAYDNPDANDQDGWLGVAVDGQGDVIVVGYETTLDEDANALVRKYHPL